MNNTYRAIQLSFIVHAQIETTVHSSNAYQPNSKAYEFQNTWRRITQLFSSDSYKDERTISKKLNNKFLDLSPHNNNHNNCIVI